MKTNLTIILFLKERKDFNKRFIDYFFEHNLGFNLLISDGSKKTDKNLLNRIKKNNLIKYVKFPEDKSYEIFYKKIFKTLKLVKTKYVFFASNDDFIIYPTLKKCVNFLIKQKKIIGCGGTMIGFEMLKKNGFDFKLTNFHNIYNYKKIDHENKIDRFDIYLKNPSDHIKNCVIEKKIFLKTYKYSSNLFRNNADLKDDFSCLYTLASGPVKILKKPLILHQDHLNSDANQRPDFVKSNFVNSNFINDLIIFDKILSFKLKLKRKIVMNKYYSCVIKNQLNHLDLQRELSFKQIKSLLFKKFQRRIFNKKFKKINSIKFDKLDIITKKVIYKIEKYLINNIK